VRRDRQNITVLFILMGLGLWSVLPCDAIKMGREGKKMTSEELNSPKIVREGKALEVMEKKDHDPPIILHVPIREAKRATALTITATISDQSGIDSATLLYRTIGQNEYKRIRMEPLPDDAFLAIIPEFVVIEEGVEYFITAVDPLGNPPGFSGSETRPHCVSFVRKEQSRNNNIFAFFLLVGGILVVTVVPRFVRKKGPVI